MVVDDNSLLRMDNIEYVKSLDDEIDWKIIDQIHTATLNFSTTSLELKKIFLVLIGIAVPSLIKLAGDKIDTSLFVTIYLLALAFWSLDSFTYFYQEKLREKMDVHFANIKNRNLPTLTSKPVIGDDFTLENSRTSSNRIRRSIVNLSVMLYMFVVGLNTVALVLYLMEII
ncbi:hypothetical protein QWY99_00590 [Flavobacterium branchiarum]|uniref:SMODS and SLOG-associating 2TM effector domain-containing protein n=1 Tax=Flavobacterium branchiarum TaxID=1114870 RepID=A0ABV5FRD9_9FLAO|nr:hypothetical protein [Flavobacterium branchiarum]MDN3671562.1 hypothetical protein [Flavobacterium branchiarum]